MMPPMALQRAIRPARPRRSARRRRRLPLNAELWAVTLTLAFLPAWAASQQWQQLGGPIGLVASAMSVPGAMAHEGRVADAALRISEPAFQTEDVWNTGDRCAQVTGTGSAGLRVRTGPGLQYPAVVILRESAVVRVVRAVFDEQRIRWVELAGEEGSGVAGWSSAQFLTPLPPGELPSSEKSAPRSIVLGRILPVTVTAYTYQVPGNGAHGWITKSGDLAAWGIVAVDPRVIPLGSELAIEGYTDLFLASDTGFGVLGHHVDIFFAEHQRAVEFGVQQRDVIVYERGIGS